MKPTIQSIFRSPFPPLLLGIALLCLFGVGSPADAQEALPPGPAQTQAPTLPPAPSGQSVPPGLPVQGVPQTQPLPPAPPQGLPQPPAPGGGVPQGSEAPSPPQLPTNAEVQANQLSPKPLPDDPAKAPVFAELEKWHADVLADFKVNLVTLHDPFMPIETVARPPERDQQSESDRRRLPMIQRLALNQFTLSAIIVAANPSDNTALVDSGGVGYLIRKGTKIGPNNGIVKEITDTKVIIEEPDVSYSGGETARITEFKLNILDNDAVIQEGEGEGAGAAGASPAPSGDGNV